MILELSYKIKPNLPPPSKIMDKQNFYKCQSINLVWIIFKELGSTPLLPILCHLNVRFKTHKLDFSQIFMDINETG